MIKPVSSFIFIVMEKSTGEKNIVVYGATESPLGIIRAASINGVVTDLSIRTSSKAFIGRLSARFGPDVVLEENSRVLAGLFNDLKRYFMGEPVEFVTPIDPGGSPFNRGVWEALRKIPRGEIVSYADVARRVGSPGAARAVGGACGANPIPIIIPCHRVVRSCGSLGGYSGGLDIKVYLLEIEGVSLEKLKR